MDLTRLDWTNIFALSEALKRFVEFHLPAALLIMFAGGVLSSLSPASVPRMVAIVDYAGRNAQTLGAALVLALAFVAGICVVYASIGALAGSFGAMLAMTGFLYYFTAALCLVMGLTMIRLVELPWKLPAFDKLGRGIPGAFLLGVGFAFLIAPDATPFMVGALAVSTFQGKFGLGALLMLAFGVGHGVPVMFAGALGPWYARNPAVKRWHVAAEMAAGYVLVFLAMFFAVIA